jgi:hypothetical protein
MDKRNLLFIVVFSIAIFGLNFAFKQWNENSYRQWKIERDLKEEKEAAR